jgi:hypothetical protein
MCIWDLVVLPRRVWHIAPLNFYFSAADAICFLCGTQDADNVQNEWVVALKYHF